MTPFVLAAPNGARRGPADHPAIPVSISETIEVALSCKAAGAHGLHLHVRDVTGGHSLDTGLYREALAELSARAPGWPVQVTTESGGVFDVPDQLRLIEDLQPAWTTVSLREAARDRGLAERLYRTATAQGTEIQHIIFDAADAEVLAEWQKLGVLGEDASVILVLGRYTEGMVSDPSELQPLLDSLPPVGKWMLCAFGPSEHACLLEAARRGGDVRVGFENSFLRADGTPHSDNAASVLALLDALSRPPTH